MEDKGYNRLRNDARTIFEAALCAVAPGACIRKHCRKKQNALWFAEHRVDLDRIENVYIVGAGKASAAMALEIEAILGDRITGGMLNVKYGHTENLERIGLTEAGHPIPDANGVQGTGEILNLLEKAGEKDLVVCLFSGGGSALLPHPVQAITFEDKQAVTRVMLGCGATIHEMNTVRKHLSSIKGGLLSHAAWPATVINLILSDVVGDNLDVIASGPTVPDLSTYADCLDIIVKYGISEKLPTSVMNHLRKGAAGDLPETPKPSDPVFEKTQNLIIGSNFQAVIAAEKVAQKMGYPTLVLSSMIEGETREVAKVHGAIAREMLKSGHPIAPPACILSGGETTVTLTGDGKGGRSQEFALAAAMDISESDTIIVLSAGTDGNDGPTDAAGALVDDRTVGRAQALGMSPVAYLKNSDAYHFFQKLDDLVITDPTNTNVMDIRVILVV